MLEMNKVMLIGNLTRDPKPEAAEGFPQLCKPGVAVNRRFKKANGEQQEEVAFVDLVCWGKNAEFAQTYLKKGTRVYVEGRLTFNTWTDKEEKKRSKLEVTVDRIQFALPRSYNEDVPAVAAPAFEPAPLPPPAVKTPPAGVPLPQAADAADDLPF